MVAMSSAMCAFLLIYGDRNCREKDKDPNELPLQVVTQRLALKHFR